MPEQKIDYTFKMLYVIGIIMIVDGHLGTIDYLDLVTLFQYSDFHIGLFIFTSGYFLSLCYTYKNFLLKKISKLIIPLYAWNLCYGILCWYLNTYQGFKIGDAFNLYNLLVAPITDGHQFIYNMGGWFIIPLFACQLISFLILKPMSRASTDGQYTPNPHYLAIFFALSLCLGMKSLDWINDNGNARNFTLALLRTLYFLPIFVFGTLYHHILKKYDKLSTPVALCTFAGITSLMGYIYPGHLMIPSWLTHQGTTNIGYYIFTFSAVMFYLYVAKALTPLIKNSSTLKYIADHTFDIMMHHFIGFMFIKSLMQKFQHFNYHSYKTDIWYNYFPMQERYCDWWYIVITIVIALLTGFTSRQICARIKKSIGIKLLHTEESK